MRTTWTMTVAAAFMVLGLASGAAADDRAPADDRVVEAGECNAYGCYEDGGGCNAYGCWDRGGGCNAYGCWRNHGGCNAYGCWHSPRGSCNAYGCTDDGECNAYGCPPSERRRDRHRDRDRRRRADRDRERAAFYAALGAPAAPATAAARCVE